MAIRRAFKDILAHDTTVADYNVTEIGLGGQIFALYAAPPRALAARAIPASVPLTIIMPISSPGTSPFAFLLGRIGSVTATTTTTRKASR